MPDNYKASPSENHTANILKQLDKFRFDTNRGMHSANCASLSPGSDESVAFRVYRLVVSMTCVTSYSHQATKLFL